MRLCFGLLCAMLAGPVAAQNNALYHCNGKFAGLPLQGQLLVQYLTYSRTYGYYGTFFDGGGTRFDFEVISNQNGGVGGAWVNGARHRESRIEMRYAGNQMRINNLDTGQSGAFICN